MSDKIELRNGVIFDLDGTLVNSARDVARILNLVMAQKDVVQFSIREVERFMGDGIPATIRKALLSRQCSATQKQVAALSDAFVAIYMERPVVDTTVYPQAMDLLAGLRKRGLGIGVCTNKAEAPARLILEHTGLMTYVDALVGGDSGFGYKPKAGPLIACAQALGVAPANVLYVGDHAVDLAAGRAAGVRVVLAEYGYSDHDVTTLGADATIKSLGEISKYLPNH